MAVLAVVKKGAGTLLKKAANSAGNVIARASSLSTVQLDKIEELREKYLTELPETGLDEHMKRVLGSYAIETYEAYLSQIQDMYRPISLGDEDDTNSLNHRIRYFEITKWVTDPTEDNYDKLTNVFRTVSEDACNIALIYNRKKEGCRVYLAVVNNELEDSPEKASLLGKRLLAAVQGNFPGAETITLNGGTYDTGVPEPLKFTKGDSLAIVSNIPAEKSEKFVSQSIEKLLDGIVPRNASEEYTIVLLATPTQDALERKAQMSDLYSQIAPLANWSTTYTYTEATAEGSGATSGLHIGASIGRQTGVTETISQGSAHQEGSGVQEAHATQKTETDSQGKSKAKTEGEQETKTTTKSDTKSKQTTKQESTTNTETDSTSKSVNGSNSDFESYSKTGSANVGGGVNLGIFRINAGGGVSTSKAHGHSTTSGWAKSFSKSVAKSITKSLSQTTGTAHTDSESIGKAINKAVTDTLSSSHSVSKGVTDTISKSKTVADTISKMASTASNVGHSLGANIGANFARSSTVNVTIGKNESLTQNFTNYAIQDMLEVLKKQMQRLDQSATLGMWEFSAYFLSKSQTIANNAAHMYLSLTQGNESYLSQAAVNFWENNGETENDIDQMMTFLKRLQHPEFVLDRMEENWEMYPPHVNATVCLTGREIAYAMNLPKKSVSGIPVLESVAFGRDVQYSDRPVEQEDIEIGKIYHMRKTEDIPVRLNLKSFCSHMFVTGSTGAGKSNFIYNVLNMGEECEEPYKFLVIEPAKGEYKHVFGNREDVFVYGSNAAKTPLLRLNPFSFPKDVHVLEHIDRLIEIFNVCWPMYAAMPAVLKSAVEKAYTDCGWNLELSENAYGDNLYPCFADVARNVKTIIDSSEYDAENKGAYKGSLLTRLQSLTTGIYRMIFNSDEIPAKSLFDENVIVDLSRVGSVETKSLLMGILILKLQEYRSEQESINAPLKHVTVLEEAHHLLKRTSTEQVSESSNLLGKSVEMLSNAIAEMRTYGEGFIIADQAPGLLDMAVIRNTNTKVILRLPDQSDRELVGKAAGLTDNQITELVKLPCGVAAVFQNEWIQPVLCKINKFNNSAEKYRYQPIKVVQECNYEEPLRIAELLSNGTRCDHDMIMRDIIPIMQRMRLSSFTQIRIMKYLESPPSEPRMTKLAPIISELFPEIRQAITEVYAESRQPVEWTKCAEQALYMLLGREADNQVRRDIVQAVITDYVFNERNSITDLERWHKEGGLH